MNTNSLNQLRRLLVLAALAVAAMAIAAAAGAAGGSANAVPDVFERYAASHPYGVVAAPDVFERYVSSHPFGRALALGTGADRAGVATGGTDRIVDDSFRDPTPIATPAGERIVDDSFRDAPTAAVSQPGGGLDWGDVGIGAGAMLGLTALLAGLGLGALSLRHKSGRLGTS